MPNPSMLLSVACPCCVRQANPKLAVQMRLSLSLWSSLPPFSEDYRCATPCPVYCRNVGGGAHLVFVCLSVCGGTVNKMETGQGRQLVPAFGFHTYLQGLSLSLELPVWIVQLASQFSPDILSVCLPGRDYTHACLCQGGGILKHFRKDPVCKAVLYHTAETVNYLVPASGS